jgi:uncharacterized phage-associated protein
VGSLGGSMIQAKNIAEYFLFQGKDSDYITNLKLQKLVYYAQGFYLAIYNKPLFQERIEAWTHGPVIPDLYHSYKRYGSQPLPRPVDVDFSFFDENTIELLNEIYKTFGSFSAWALRNLTHRERPWLETPNGQEISLRLLRDYFRTQIVEH